MPTRTIIALMLSLLVLPAFAQDDIDQLRLKAEQGDAEAQFNLGYMYTEGLGVPLDNQEAVRWYRLAAEQGFANAQFNLGAMTSIGWLGWAVLDSPLRGWDPTPSSPSTLS